MYCEKRYKNKLTRDLKASLLLKTDYKLFILQIWEDGWYVLRFQMHIVMHVIHYTVRLITKKVEHQQERVTTLKKGMDCIILLLHYLY